MSDNKLLKALNEFQGLSVSAGLSGVNPHFRSEYSTLEDVIKAANQGSQFGLVFTQEINFTDEMQVFVETTIRHMDCMESIKCKVPVFCKDITNPHQLGSGITYAKRYGLQSLYGLPSEDDDGNSAKEGKAVPLKKPTKKDVNLKGIAEETDPEKKAKIIEDKIKEGKINESTNTAELAEIL
jgi:hypothetical protein